eukprot:1453329-Lingulodinium_polyedra.AAC.1
MGPCAWPTRCLGAVIAPLHHGAQPQLGPSLAVRTGPLAPRVVGRMVGAPPWARAAAGDVASSANLYAPYAGHPPGTPAAARRPL